MRLVGPSRRVADCSDVAQEPGSCATSSPRHPGETGPTSRTGLAWLRRHQHRACQAPAAGTPVPRRHRDRARYQRYAAAFLPILARYGGRLLAADEHPEVTEGQWDDDKVVLDGLPGPRDLHGAGDLARVPGDSRTRLAAAETTESSSAA